MSQPITLVFVIYRYFPFGGAQRDFMRILLACQARGFAIQVFALKWKGEIPEGVTVTLAPCKALSRTALYTKFSDWLSTAVKNVEGPRVIVGFNKMPGLDVYYAADPCFEEVAATQRGAYYKYTARYRHFRRFEQAVFARASATRILYLSPQQRKAFTRYYPGCESRLVQLPPGLAEDRRPPDATAEAQALRSTRAREELLAELGLASDCRLILQIGSGFKVKGVDRSLRAVAALNAPQVHYLLVGADKAAPFRRLARRLGIAKQVSIVPGRSDVPALLAAADLLLHPAYRESAGYTLLEAVVAGLPVLTTQTCGYAFHVQQAGAGVVCDEPFSQEQLNTHLAAMLAQLNEQEWSADGLRYGQNDELYSMPEAAAEAIMQAVGKTVEP